MKFGRYKYRDWNRAYEDNANRLRSMLNARAPKVMVEMQTRMLLNSCHAGPWRAIAALVKHELKSIWMRYGWWKWEWIRTKVFRRPQDQAIAEFERVSAEQDAVEEMVNQL